LLSPGFEEIGYPDESTEGINPVVSAPQVCVGDVMEHGLGIQRPIRVNQVTETQAGLGGKLDRLADGILGSILVGIRKDDSGPGLDVGNKISGRLDEVIPNQRRSSAQVIPRALVDQGIGHLEKGLKIAPQEGTPGAGLIQGQSESKIGLPVIQGMDMVVGKFRGKKYPLNELDAQPVFEEGLHRIQAHHFKRKRGLRAPEAENDYPEQEKTGEE